MKLPALALIPILIMVQASYFDMQGTITDVPAPNSLKILVWGGLRGAITLALALSLADQITLFSEAEAVVGPHGAGFTNLIWCAPDTKVLEFFSPLYVNLCYWAISSLTRADYFYLLGSADGQVDDVNDARFFLENVCVDPVALERTLEAMEDERDLSLLRCVERVRRPRRDDRCPDCT